MVVEDAVGKVEDDVGEPGVGLDVARAETLVRVWPVGIDVNRRPSDGQSTTSEKNLR